MEYGENLLKEKKHNHVDCAVKCILVIVRCLVFLQQLHEILVPLDQWL